MENKHNTEGGITLHGRIRSHLGGQIPPVMGHPALISQTPTLSFHSIGCSTPRPCPPQWSKTPATWAVLHLELAFLHEKIKQKSSDFSLFFPKNDPWTLT